MSSTSQHCAVVVYESMYGNTHVIAEHIADGLRAGYDVTVVPVSACTEHLLAGTDLLVCGGPTHVHGMPSATSRKAAAAALDKHPELALDAAATGPGVRDLFETMDRDRAGDAAAFDTRIDGPAILTGRASKGVARRLRDHGYRLVLEPESFLVDKQNHLLEGEAERAVAWGVALAAEAAHIPS